MIIDVCGKDTTFSPNFQIFPHIFPKSFAFLFFFFLTFAPMFEKEIEEYELVRKEYQQKIADRMGERRHLNHLVRLLVIER
jgi:hypothetical protein